MIFLADSLLNSHSFDFCLHHFATFLSRCFICWHGWMQRLQQGFYFFSGVPQVLCFRTLRRLWNECSLTHTHTQGSSLLTLQTSKLAVPRGTSNAGEAIKRQKLFSVRSWFIWLKNETINPTDIIFPSQGLLYRAEPKLLPGGNPLKSRKAQPEETKLSCLLLSSCLSFDSVSHLAPASFSVSIFLEDVVPSVTTKNKLALCLAKCTSVVPHSCQPMKKK